MLNTETNSTSQNKILDTEILKQLLFSMKRIRHVEETIAANAQGSRFLVEMRQTRSASDDRQLHSRKERLKLRERLNQSLEILLRT